MPISRARRRTPATSECWMANMYPPLPPAFASHRPSEVEASRGLMISRNDPLPTGIVVSSMLIVSSPGSTKPVPTPRRERSNALAAALSWAAMITCRNFTQLRPAFSSGLMGVFAS